MGNWRRMVYAASALVCSFMCASSAWGVYVQDIVNRDDFSTGVRQRVDYSIALGGLTLSKTLAVVPFLWVPSRDSNTVSKVDARTGVEMARYNIGPASESWGPCAVTTDNDGNAYVACSGYGTTGKIVRILADPQKDVTGDGAVKTCSDTDSNFKITPVEVLPWGKDDAVDRVISIGSQDCTPTCITADGSGYLWVSLWGTGTLAKVDFASGQVMANVQTSGKPTAMIMGDRGDLWVVSNQTRSLTQVNTVSESVIHVYDLGDSAPAGMCYDSESGRLWMGDIMGGLIEVQTQTGSISTHQTDDQAGFAGVTLDQNGDVWAACPNGNYVAHFSGEDGSLIAKVPVGKGPQSVSIDEDGYAWVLNEEGYSASRVDTTEDKCVLTTRTSNAPFCSTSFATFKVEKGVSPSGMWSRIADAGFVGAGWGKITWDSNTGIGTIKVEVRAADTYDDLAQTKYTEISNGKEFAEISGRYLEVRSTLTGMNGVSPVLHALKIEGINLAPDIKNAVATTQRISKIDGTMEPVSIAGIFDPEGDPFTVTITNITQDEPIKGLNEEDKGPDATGIGSSVALLRGECDLGTADKPGNGRVYIVSYKAVDALGASSTGSVKVTVPVGILPKDVAVDDGQKYKSTGDEQDHMADNQGKDNIQVAVAN